MVYNHLKWAEVEARHLYSMDGLDRVTTVQDVLPTPGSKTYIIRIKKDHPSDANLVPVQNGGIRNKGRSTPDDWDTSNGHRVASVKHYQGFTSTVLLTSQEGLRRTASSLGTTR
jgi:hypothetical protein